MNIVIVGAGSIGCQAIKLAKNHDVTVIDRDIVQEENIKTQTYRKQDIGLPKATAIMKYFAVKGLAIELTEKNTYLLNADIILDCVDNIGTRRIIHKYCMKKRIPWIHSAANKDVVQVMAITPKHPCFESVFGGKTDGEKCTADNISKQTAKIAAKLQYQLAKKIMKNKLVKPILYRGIINNIKEIKVSIEKPNNSKVKLKKLCGSDMFQYYSNNKSKKIVRGNNYWIFTDGRILIKAKNEVEAKLILKLIK